MHADNKGESLHTEVYNTKNVCMCTGVACGSTEMEKDLPITAGSLHALIKWKSQENHDLFTREHLPTFATPRWHCVLLCSSAPGLGLRGTEKAGESILEELRPPSVSFSGFVCSFSASSISVSLWGQNHQKTSLK